MQTKNCCGFFVPASVVFYIAFHHLLNDRGFKVFQVLATECSDQHNEERGKNGEKHTQVKIENFD